MTSRRVGRSSCWACLKPIETGSTYHPRCLKELFGSARVPRIDLELAKLHTADLAMVGHTSLSGIQAKISLGLTADRSTLQLAVEGGRYIVKPSQQALPHLAENEHVTMRLAEAAGIEIPPCALVALADDSLAYLVRRFDRTADGRKLAQEDFCQLAEKSPKDKYDGSAELLARLVARFASEAPIEALKLLRLVVFAWWTGNGDLHLKNVSLLTGHDGVHRLSPAYDLLCTKLVIPDDALALTVCGKKDRLTRDDWLEFARYCHLPQRAGDRILRDLASLNHAAREMIDRCFLPPEMKEAYGALISERSAILAPS